jgi:hypothetical protein
MRDADPLSAAIVLRRCKAAPTAAVIDLAVATLDSRSSEVGDEAAAWLRRLAKLPAGGDASHLHDRLRDWWRHARATWRPKHASTPGQGRRLRADVLHQSDGRGATSAKLVLVFTTRFAISLLIADARRV